MNKEAKLAELRKELRNTYFDLGQASNANLKEKIYKKRDKLIGDIENLEKSFDLEKHTAKAKKYSKNSIHDGKDQLSKAARLHRNYQKEEKHRIFNNVSTL